MMNLKMNILSFCLFLFSALFLFGCPSTPQNQEDAKIENVTYNEETFMFTWDKVPGANQYEIKINGKKIYVESNEYFYIPNRPITEFQVKPSRYYGDYYEYLTWSDVYTHDATKSEDLLVRTYLLADKIAVGKEVVEVVGFYIEEKTFHMQVVYHYNHEDFLHDLWVRFSTPIESFNQVVEAIYNENDENIKTIIIGMGDFVVKYDSVNFLLKSKTLPDQLGEYRLDGYDISVVASYTAKMDNCDDGEAFQIHSIFKLEKEGTVKYVQSLIQCEIIDPHSNPATNFTLRLQNDEERDAYVLGFHELTGDLEEIAKRFEEVSKLIPQK